MTMISAAAESAGGGGMAVLLPPLYEIFWSAIILLILWVVLGFALPMIYAMIDKRTEEIEAGLRASETAQENAALAERERKDVLREANERAREIREKASQDSQRIVAQARETALEEAARIAEGAERQIAADQKAAELTLRRDLGALSTELAEKIIGEQLKDEALSARIIDRFMDDLENDLSRTTVEVANQ